MKDRLAAVGDNCIDVYEGLGELVGGNALNVAVDWRRAGGDALYAGSVGDDRDGRRVRSALTAAGVPDTLLRTDAGVTGRTHLRLTADGERVIGDEDFGTSGEYALGAAERAALAGAAWVHGATAPGVGALLADLRGSVASISYDFSTRHETDGLDGLDVAFYAWEREPGEALDALLDAALAGGAGLAVALCGRHGSVARGAGGTAGRLRGGEITPVDTCGAGDAYIASFVLARLGGAGLEPAMASGTSAAEAACLHVGAWPQDVLDPAEVTS